MDKTATLIGAAAILAASPALAAQSADAGGVPPATSYAELLRPIPNAIERLKVSDAQEQAKPQVIEAQYNAHHHHHHHHRNRAWYLSNGYLWFGNRWVTRTYYHHHHHHNHHHHNHY